MDAHLTSKGEEQLRALARKIGASHELDAEVQEELFGHLEDQALAYLSGEEAVTEDDAILLTREHFGDARALKEWLGSVHAQADHSRFYVRLVPVAVLTLVWHAGALASGQLPIRDLWPISLILWTLFAVWILLQWRRQERRGQSMWWEHGKTRWVALGVAIALPLVSYHGWLDYSPPITTVSFLPRLLSQLLVLVSWLMMPFMWLWWADLPPRRWRTSINTVGAYFLLHLTLEFLKAGMVVLLNPSRQFSPVSSVVAAQVGTLLPLALVLFAWWGFHYGARRIQARLG